MCKAIKSDGTPCTAPPGKGSEYCFHHDPARKEEAAEVRRKGCEASKEKRLNPESRGEHQPLRQFRLNSLDDVKRLLAATINEFRQARISADEARVTAYVANILIGAIKDGEVESRFKVIEEIVREHEKEMQYDRF
jgi:hypothetical protein